jgi:hypothetical protein
MKNFPFLIALLLLPLGAQANRGHACAGTMPCEGAVGGSEFRLCRAYKEHQGCASLPPGDERGWCEVITEGKSCYEALIGNAQEACEEEQFPGSHLYWKKCGGL